MRGAVEAIRSEFKESRAALLKSLIDRSTAVCRGCDAKVPLKEAFAGKDRMFYCARCAKDKD